MRFFPRLLWVETEASARDEILRVGADPAGCVRMASKMVPRMIKLSRVPCRAANILKQEMLSLGGDAAVARGSVACSVDTTEVILIGSLNRLRKLCQRLPSQPFGLAALADELKTLLSHLEEPAVTLDGRTCRLTLDRPRIMGILNVTPDSFSDGGRFDSVENALRHAATMVDEGADMIDVGGESTRPGAPMVGAQEEIDRVVPVVERLCREFDIPLSVDTTKSSVATAAVSAGAEFINDISGLTFDSQMAACAASTGAGLFVMHTRGRPDRMQKNTCYDDLLAEVMDVLQCAIDEALVAGVQRSKIAIDPGIGFGKDLAGNLELIRRLREFHSIGCPILLGTSRKSFIGKVLDQPAPLQRLYGSMATVVSGVERGAQIFRVHDVGPSREAALMAWAVCREGRHKTD